MCGSAGVELASYLTTCKMQPAHLLLAVRMAMTTAFRAQNFITAASVRSTHAMRMQSIGLTGPLTNECIASVSVCVIRLVGWPSIHPPVHYQFAKRIIQGNMAGQRSVREAVEQVRTHFHFLNVAAWTDRQTSVG